MKATLFLCISLLLASCGGKVQADSFVPTIQLSPSAYAWVRGDGNANDVPDQFHQDENVEYLGSEEFIEGASIFQIRRSAIGSYEILLPTAKSWGSYNYTVTPVRAFLSDIRRSTTFEADDTLLISFTGAYVDKPVDAKFIFTAFKTTE